jgi:integrase
MRRIRAIKAACCPTSWKKLAQMIEIEPATSACKRVGGIKSKSFFRLRLTRRIRLSATPLVAPKMLQYFELSRMSLTRSRVANFHDRYRMAPVFEAKRRSIQRKSSGGRSAVAGYPSLVNFMEQTPPQLRHELRAGQMAMVAIGGSCARFCHDSGGELEQIQFLLGHVSVQTTEKYLGCKQRLRQAVNDRIGIEPF